MKLRSAPWRNADLVLARPDHGYAVLAHQPTYAAVADIQADLFQPFGHSQAAIPTQAETLLFMRQRDHIRPRLAGRLCNARNPRGLTSIT